MIRIATTSPKIAVPSARAPPKSRVFVILLSASGCLATASAAFPVAIPIPIPPPIQANAAIPAPIAVKLIISSVPPPAAAVFFLFLLFSFSAIPSAAFAAGLILSACTGGRSLLDRLIDKEGSKEYKYVGLDQAVKNIKVKAEGHRQRHRKQDLDQFHDDKRSQHVSE